MCTMLLLLLSRISRVRLCAASQTAAYKAPPSLGFSRQEHWSGLPFPSPGDLPDPVIEPMSPALAGGFFTIEPPGKPKNNPRQLCKTEFGLSPYHLECSLAFSHSGMDAALKNPSDFLSSSQFITHHHSVF